MPEKKKLEDLPDFDSFHPNADSCRNACEYAAIGLQYAQEGKKKEAEGSFEEALSWFEETRFGLEYSENADDRERTHEFIVKMAKKAKMDDWLSPKLKEALKK